MHPWTKAYLDLYSEDDLETLFSIEKQMKKDTSYKQEYIESFTVETNVVFSADDISKLSVVGDNETSIIIGY